MQDCASKSTTRFNLQGKRVWVAGHNGMVGRAIVRRLEGIDCELLVIDRSNLDLTSQSAVLQWLGQMRPDVVFLAAAKVGGILANAQQPAQFLHENLMIQSNVIHGAWLHGVQKLLFLGSSCIYPKYACQPIEERALLTGALEPTNEAYAIAKIAGVKLCQFYRVQYGADFVAALPCNLYGPGDNFDPTTSHVIPALIRKVHDAKKAGEPKVTIWGTGTPRREFLFADDCADALVHIMQTYSGASHINVGTGTDVTILELLNEIARTIGHQIEVDHDTGKPDGTLRKLLDIGTLKDLGWSAKTSLADGLAQSYAWFLEHNVG